MEEEKILTSDSIWMNLEHTMPEEISQAQKLEPHGLIYGYF